MSGPDAGDEARDEARDEGGGAPGASVPLDPDPQTLARWLDDAAGFVRRELAAFPAAPAHGAVGSDGLAVAARATRPIPETPQPGGLPALLEHIGEAAQASLFTPGGGYLAYVPGGGLPASAIADLVSGMLNRYTGVGAAAPAFVRLEADVLAWLASHFGYGEGARGLVTSGGSLSILSAIVTARHAAFGDSGALADAVVYTSTQAHHAVAKAASLAGIARRRVHAIPVDDRFRLDARALATRINTDLAAGLRPFAVVSAGGTTNTGAVDPFEAIADLCEAHGLWHHCDGAYGGAFVLCDEGRRRLAGIERADSVTFDPHKGMFLPYGTGCLLVRDGRALLAAHGAEADYLQDFDAFERTGEAPSPAVYGPELSRPYRGLRLWLPLMLHGAGAFREALTHKLALADRFHAGLQRLARSGAPIEIVDAPQLSTVPFRLRRAAGESLAQLDRRNAAWLAAINDRAHVYMSSTKLPFEDGSAFTLRACVLSFRTHETHVDAALDDLAATWERVV